MARLAFFGHTVPFVRRERPEATLLDDPDFHEDRRRVRATIAH